MKNYCLHHSGQKIIKFNFLILTDIIFFYDITKYIFDSEIFLISFRSSKYWL